MAAAPGNPLVDIWRHEVHAYWMDSPPQLWLSQTRQGIAKRLMEAAWHLVRERPRRASDYLLYPLGMLMRTFPVFLLSPLFRDVLKIAPILWMGLIFKRSCEKDPSFRQIWDQTPKVRATGLIGLGGLAGLVKPISAGIKQEIDEGLVSVYKLNWRLDPADIVPGTFVHYLFAMIPYKSCENRSEVSTGLTTDSGHEHDQS